MDILELYGPFDAHFHPRRGEMLGRVLESTAQSFSSGIAMPNTAPPILDARSASDYRTEIRDLCQAKGFVLERQFEPLMTIMVTPQTTPEMIHEAKRAGVIAGKFYPKGLTTNSDLGFDDFFRRRPILKAMGEAGMVACFHPEATNDLHSAMEREIRFLSDISFDLVGVSTKIVFEHITTRKAIEWVKKWRENGMNIAATIMPHYLVLTLDDVIGYSKDSGGKMRPDLFCKPIPKTRDDCRALLEVILSGDPGFFFGSDSAPHDPSKKYCAQVSPGIFTAPVALPLLAQIFEDSGCLDKLTKFVSENGRNFYGLPPDSRIIRLVKRDWVVPEQINGIVPFMAGETLHWQVVD